MVDSFLFFFFRKYMSNVSPVKDASSKRLLQILLWIGYEVFKYDFVTTLSVKSF